MRQACLTAVAPVGGRSRQDPERTPRAGLITLAEQQPQNQGAGLISQLLMFALIIVVFYLLFIRPQQKRRQQELEMQKSLQREWKC